MHTTNMDMEKNKTLAYLDSKPWYRAIKVLYFVFVGLCYLVATASIIGFWVASEFELALIWIILLDILIVPWAIFWAWVISAIPKWIFYYIYFGSIKPPK